MTCRPECNPACEAGMACDYSASVPVCILPNPQDFTLFISMSERFQVPILYDMTMYGPDDWTIYWKGVGEWLSHLLAWDIRYRRPTRNVRHRCMRPLIGARAHMYGYAGSQLAVEAVTLTEL